jgi:hypothetical protein
LFQSIQTDLAIFLAPSSSKKQRARAASRLVRRGPDALPYLVQAAMDPLNREMSPSAWRLVEEIALNWFEQRSTRE